MHIASVRWNGCAKMNTKLNCIHYNKTSYNFYTSKTIYVRLVHNFHKKNSQHIVLEYCRGMNHWALAAVKCPT